MYEFNRLGRSEGHDVDLEHVLAPSIELGRGKIKTKLASLCAPLGPCVLLSRRAPAACRTCLKKSLLKTVDVTLAGARDRIATLSFPRLSPPCRHLPSFTNTTSQPTCQPSPPRPPSLNSTTTPSPLANRWECSPVRSSPSASPNPSTTPTSLPLTAPPSASTTAGGEDSSLAGWAPVRLVLYPFFFWSSHGEIERRARRDEPYFEVYEGKGEELY
jgi:hypothetical protein